LDPTKIFHRRLFAFERLKFAMERGENIPSETLSRCSGKLQAKPRQIQFSAGFSRLREERIGYVVAMVSPLSISLENMSIERHARRIRCPTVALAAGRGAESN